MLFAKILIKIFKSKACFQLEIPVHTFWPYCCLGYKDLNAQTRSKAGAIKCVCNVEK